MLETDGGWREMTAEQYPVEGRYAPQEILSLRLRPDELSALDGEGGQ